MATPIPQNCAPFSLAEVVRATGGELRPGVAHEIEGVTTDSRCELAGKLFVALAGDRFDGHAFVADAVARGAAAVLVSNDVAVPAGVAVVRVESTLDALGALARAHRRRWSGVLVAVGGSAGKTTTKSACAALLDAVAPGAVHVAAGNLNNRIGVPMVLFGLRQEHRYAVVEIGTNARGEVEALTRVAEPDVAVLTLVGLEHAEGLGDLDAIEFEEGALLRVLGASATAIAGADDARALRQLAASPASRKLGYGWAEHSDYRIVSRHSSDLGATKLELERRRDRSVERIALSTRLLGTAGALAATAALAVADVVTGSHVDPALASDALCRPELGEPGRLSAVELSSGTLLIDDSYNSNPPSLRSSLATAREIAGQRQARLLLVLGEMRELGALSAAAHDAIGAELAATGAAAVVAVSGDAERFACAARSAGMDAVFATDVDAALPLVSERLRAGDVVLIKASRGVRAERIVEELARAGGRAA